MTMVTVDQVYQAASALPMIPPQNAVFERPAAEPLPEILSGVTVFFDRDGTLNEDTGYIKSPEELELLPGVGAALARLKQAGARLIVLTNQSGVGRGYFSSTDLEAIHSKLQRELAKWGVTLDAVYVCPHHPDERCSCRKPARGMIDRAMADFPINPARSYVVGDSARDIDLAKQVGAHSVLVMTGPSGTEALTDLHQRGRSPDHVAENMERAVDWIVTGDGQRTAPAASAQAEPR
jgi:heptosyltransferase-2